jgi:hypothetical protein
MKQLTIITILIGLAMILGYTAGFIQSKSFLDLFLVTVGLMTITIGINIEKGETLTYFATMFTINILQWLILIYMLFANPINVNGDFITIITLSIAPVMTIYLVHRILKTNLKSSETNQSTNYANFVEHIKIGLNNKAKIILIYAGILIMLGCLVSFSHSKAGAELFGSSVGMLMIVYGFFREDKKVKVTMNYFLAMLCVNLVQWFIIFFFMSQIYQPQIVPAAFTFTALFTLTLWIQIRESDLEYLGKRRKIKTKDNGYMVCNKCNRYYKLKPDDSAGNFPDQCDCGGKLEYKYRILNQG